MCALIKSFVDEAFRPARVTFWRDLLYVDRLSPLVNLTSSRGVRLEDRELMGQDRIFFPGREFLKYFFQRQVNGRADWMDSNYLDSTLNCTPRRQIRRRLCALCGLALLLEFLVSGFVLRARNGGDFGKLMMSRRKLRRWRVLGCGCCVLEIYYLVWLEVMIDVML
jgi:hypothetical protein